MFLVCHWYVLGMSNHTFDKPYTYQEHTHNLEAISSYTCCDQIWTMNTQQQNEQSELEVLSSPASRREK